MSKSKKEEFNSNVLDNGEMQDSQYEVTKKKRKVWPWILLAAAGAAAAGVAIWFAAFNKSVKISDYVSLKYDGIDGYATPECVVDREALYEAMAGKENNSDRLASYRAFADSVTASTTGDHISNGDKLDVNVTFDESAREKTSYKVNDAQFSIVAEGIDSGKQMNLFENVSIKINGISPHATMEVVNNNTDEFLKGLVYKTDKDKNLCNGDRVMLSCEVTDDELADHGITTTSLTAMYDVSGLSEYVQTGKVLPRKLMEERVKMTLRMIAILRLMMPEINMVAATAMQTLDPFGREKAIMAGANVIMPNLTPNEFREEYLIYPDKACVSDKPDECFSCLDLRMKGIGHDILYNAWGDSPAFLKKHPRES